ncbi:MAG TPA: choice-of-anchor tandem repeat GloVer-containing protein [Verrucomicrobiae bacterium]|nr:choice-of-anchor tandem repeat GloVer-containing protein [Verrucomicrobiae bacterium]
MTFTSGTAIGWYEDYGSGGGLGCCPAQPYSISLNNGATNTFNGNATQPCYFARYTMVQEGAGGSWSFGGWMGGLVFNGGSPIPQLSANFTKFTSDNWSGNTFRDNRASGAGMFQNCEFYDFGISTYGMTSLAFTNCLLFRFNQSFWGISGSDSQNLTYDNCTFYNGGIFLGRTTPATWFFENCVFDGTDIAWSDTYNGTSYTTIAYNAYNTNNFGWTNYPYFTGSAKHDTNEVVGASDVLVPNFDWETSWFGNLYQPTNSLTFHAGSTHADALGLYWFTTDTNQAIEGTNRVTIGYHYIATDSNGIPLPEGPTPYLEIVTNPASLTVTQGYNATFSVVAEGYPLPLSYQWYLDGLALSDAGGISGSGSPTLNLTAVQPDQAGNYYVVVTNSFGSVTSSIAELTVIPSGTNYLYPQYVLAPYAYWNVTDISDPAQPVHIGELQTPFSNTNYDSGNFGQVPPPNALWHTNSSVTVTNAYGTTELGGTGNMGTVFEIGLGGGSTNIHSFTGPDGAYPCSQLAISGSTYYGIPNTLYGTTLGGGSNGYGTVFRLNADGTEFTNLYDFTGSGDGKFPRTGVLIDGNTLYGTTTNSIFKINTDGSDFTCLTTNITDASQLILSLSGETLYGTTTNGGACGTLFGINTDGGGFTNIWTFTGGSNGAFPVSGLALYGIGTLFANGPTNTVLFGTTSLGGSNNFGMVFSINTDGSGFSDLHDFDSTDDGAYPMGGLLIPNNNVAEAFTPSLFGTTSSGGANSGGTIFSMNLDGSAFQTLYSFGETNGASPKGKLVSTAQTLYGTTSSGGTNNYGTIFSFNYDDSGFTNLYNFSGGGDGQTPGAGLALPVVDNLASIWSLETTINGSDNAASFIYSIAIDNYDILYVNGNFVSWTNHAGAVAWSPYESLAPYLHQGENDIRVIIGGDNDAADYFAMAIQGYPALPNVLYGTTENGGSYSYGSVFKIVFSNEDVILHSFTEAPEGKNPIGDMVLFGNTLYGVTRQGGTNDNGTVFSVSTNGLNYQTLYTFTLTNSGDGANPEAGLLLISNTLYCTTYVGGTNGGGTIFRINTDGSGYHVLHNFGSSGDGYNPEAPLLLVGNTLYGTARNGGSGYGTVFSYSLGSSNYQTLYSFNAYSGDGELPLAGLAVSGNILYGTTSGGGANGDGTIFSYNVSSSYYTNFYNFINPYLGSDPQSGLVVTNGMLYGAIYYGGTNSGVRGNGALFRIGVNGLGYTNLLLFGSSDSDFGQNPASDLIIQTNLLYGTTLFGGTNNGGNGMVFSINTNGTDFHDIYNFTGKPDGANPNGGISSQ